MKGGCGVLLHHSARQLLSLGDEVILLLDVDGESFQRFDQVDRLALPNPQNCRAYLVSKLVQGTNLPLRAFTTYFEYKAHLFYLAARQVYKLEKPEIFEFVEYCGAGYYTLNAKIAGIDFGDSRIVVRLHNSLEMIDRYQPGNRHGLDRFIMMDMERHTLRFAESVLYPSPSYLEKIYLENYEPWFGEKVLSPPAMLDYPSFGDTAQDPDGVLFMGRLFGFKGVDSFTDAAVLYLSDPANPRRTFFYAGYDSYLPPSGRGSYKDYLLKKIPVQIRPHFIFLGQLTWAELGELLPRILFGVIPSYLKSFCYAAHELYEAGLPLIVSNIPAFEDSFRHGENALVYDGTAGDLAEKMRLLSTDANLRKRITHPYTLNREPLGDYSALTKVTSWISPEPHVDLPNLLVCILVEQPEYLERTLRSLKHSLSLLGGLPGSFEMPLKNPRREDGVLAQDKIPASQLILLYPQSESQKNPSASPDPNSNVQIWFLGDLYVARLTDGTALNPTGIKTAETLLILRSGDELDPDFLPRLSGILARQPQITFAGSWKRLGFGREQRLDTLPLDAILEIVPFIETSPFNRFVMRTVPGRLLIDLFDPRVGRLGELAYLWQLDFSQATGIVVPTVLITVSDSAKSTLEQPVLDYLILRDASPYRKIRLARFLLALENRGKVLRTFFVQDRLINPYQFRIYELIGRLATSRMSRWADSLPWLKNLIRFLVDKFLSFISGGRRKKLD